MNWIIFIAIVALLPKNEGFITRRPHLCQNVQCRPGRECGVINGEPSCVCRESCPDHWKPVCGTDGVFYDNHCLLHKAACDSNIHISPTHRRFCRRDRDALIAREEFITQLALLNDPSANRFALPSACFENDRNRLREFLASWLLLSSKKQTWYIPGMSRGEELRGHFYSADTNNDQVLDDVELLDYINKNKTDNAKRIERALCVKALTEEGDANGSGSLDFTEFQKLLSDSFSPSSKLCSLPGRSQKLHDGAETVKGCNACVCACGQWVCTQNLCDDKDYELDEEDSPEDDPDVQDLRWF